MKYAFIREQLAQSFPVRFCCEVLGVCTSGYYDARTRPVSPRQRRRQDLAQQVRHVHQENHTIYGSPRITHALRRRGVSVCRNTVARLMQEAGLRSKRCRRFRPRTTDSSRTLMPAPNLLRELTPPTQPNQVWVADITYIPIQGGYVYLAGIMDLYSRKIVGWHLGSSLDTSLTERALRTAATTRRPAAGLVHHSDRGIQYDSLRYRHLLKEHGLIQSMSRKGDCYDNAAMESFWATLKTELIGDIVYRNITHAFNHIFRFIEGFYPNQRLHSSINYATPAEVDRVII